MTQRRRPWLIAVVAAWIVVVVLLGWWSVRNDPPTVPEQRGIGAAIPVLDRATGALIAAAAGPGRAVELGARTTRDCRLTPVRRGVEVVREVTVYVPVDRAYPVLQEIAAGLPADYAAEAGRSSGGRRVGLHADAGGFVAIDAGTDSDTQEFQIRASTGCRPADAGTGRDEPTATSVPQSLTGALTAVGGQGPARVRDAPCPDGGTARTYTVDGLPPPDDLGRSLRSAVEGATVVRADPAGWAYVTGTDSVVLTEDGDTLRVSATVPCA